MVQYSWPIYMMQLWSMTINITEAHEMNYLGHICSNSTTFVRNSTYQANLNILLSSLASNATRNDINGFYNTSTGHDLYEVYGLFLCRSDVSVEVCQNCVNLATNDISNREGGYHMVWWVLPALLKQY